MMDFRDRCRGIGLEISEVEMEQFAKYAEMIEEWNQTHNIVGRLSREDIFENIFDSIYPLSFMEDFKSALDIGSGGGFPAVALAIVKSSSHFTLCEPRVKRASFLKITSMRLGLVNTTIQKCRVEELEKIEFDLITSRAVMSAKSLIDLSDGLLKRNGYYLFYKGSNLESEIDEDVDSYERFGNRIYYYKRG